VTARRDEAAPSITRSTLLAAAGEAVDKRMHEYVPDLHDLNCARCPTPRGNWRHRGDLRAAAVVLNPRSPLDRLPSEWVSVQLDLPLPRQGSQ
jgi:hypothetical protein